MRITRTQDVGLLSSGRLEPVKKILASLVLSSVGIRSPEAIEVQWERKSESKANSCSKIPPLVGARVGIFI
jgi:hypothetical protein